MARILKMTNQVRKQKKGTKQTQPRVKDELKTVLASAISPKVAELIEADAAKLGCSKSWIQHIHSAAFYGIEIPVPVGLYLKIQNMKRG